MGYESACRLGDKGQQVSFMETCPDILDKGLSPGAVQLAICSEPRGMRGGCVCLDFA